VARDDPGAHGQARDRLGEAESKIGVQLGVRQHPAERSGAG
jgi:hypothetical protein